MRAVRGDVHGAGRVGAPRHGARARRRARRAQAEAALRRTYSTHYSLSFVLNEHTLPSIYFL